MIDYLEKGKLLVDSIKTAEGSNEVDTQRKTGLLFQNNEPINTA